MMKNIFFTYKWIFGFLLIFSNLFNAQEGTKQVSPTATNLSGLLYHPANGYGSYIGASEDNNIKFVIQILIQKDFTLVSVGLLTLLLLVIQLF